MAAGSHPQRHQQCLLPLPLPHPQPHIHTPLCPPPPPAAAAAQTLLEFLFRDKKKLSELSRLYRYEDGHILDMAASNGDVQMVKLLLDFEMTVGPSALAHAAHYNHTEVMEVRGVRVRVTASDSPAGRECLGVGTGRSTQGSAGEGQRLRCLDARVVHPVATSCASAAASSCLPAACSTFLPANTLCCCFVGVFLHGCRC